MVDERKPWEKEPTEPDLWFDRFTRYRLLGPARSLSAVYRKEPKPKGSKRRALRKGAKGREKARKVARQILPGSWRKAAKDWRWQARAEAFDEAQRQVTEEEWLRRREEWRSQEWNLGTKMGLKLNDLLYQKISPGTLNPQDLKYLSDALEKSSKVVRLALGLVTERQSHEMESSADAKGRLADRIRAIVDRLAAPQGAAGTGDSGPAERAPGG